MTWLITTYAQTNPVSKLGNGACALSVEFVV